MSPTRRRGRHVPPRPRGTGPAMPPGARGPIGNTPAAQPHGASPTPPAPPPAPSPSGAGERAPAQPARVASRSANRAAKRAASGRPPAGAARRPARRPSSTGPLLALAAVAAAVIVGVIAFGNPFGFGGGGADASPTAGAGASASPGGSAVAGACPISPPPPLPAGETRTVTIATDLGDIVIEVDGALSPIAAGNFVALAECGFYDGVVFHRTAALADGTPFVIQGGDPSGDGTGGPGYTIEDEPVTETYGRGTVAMARTQAPNSQGSQFFIVLDDGARPALESANTYAIFGAVAGGMEVADAIYQASNGAELPADPVAMLSVTVSDGPVPPGSPDPSGLSPSGSPDPPTSDAPTQ